MPRPRIAFIGSLIAVLAASALWTLITHTDNRVGSASPFPTPDEGPSSSTFGILRVVGDNEPPPEVGDVVVLPPGVDTDEEKLAYLQKLGDSRPSPTASNPIAPDLSIIASLESRGIDPEEFARELYKGEESVQELIERLATR